MSAAMSDSTVHIVDDDAEFRSILVDLVESAGLVAKQYESADAFLAALEPGKPGCVVTDLRMPGLSGADLQAALQARDADLPVVVLSAFIDVQTAVQIMRAGALDVMEKVRSQQDLLEAIKRGLRDNAERRVESAARREILERVAKLTAREREVLALVAEGHQSKAIAADLGISVNTVEVHRSHIMKKLKAQTVADVVRMALLAKA